MVWGSAACFTGIADTYESDESSICFKPLHPPLTLRSHIVWKKYKVFPKAIEIFLEILNEEIKKKQ